MGGSGSGTAGGGTILSSTIPGRSASDTSGRGSGTRGGAVRAARQGLLAEMGRRLPSCTGMGPGGHLISGGGDGWVGLGTSVCCVSSKQVVAAGVCSLRALLKLA